MNRRMTLSVGIPAHNEEKNIGKLLNMLIKQKQENFSLKEILVVCDGCTDRTSGIVTNFSEKHKEVHLVDDGERLGKASRLNYIFDKHKSDIVICIDADSQVTDKNVLNDISACFIRNPKLGLVGGNDKPLYGNSFLEKTVVSWIRHWQRVTRPVNNWVNPHNSHGVLCALSKEFSKKVRVPSDVRADDFYIFYKSRELGYEFEFCKEAIVYFRAPGNIGDIINQSVRFGKSGAHARSLFKNLDPKYEHIPLSKRYFAYLQSVVFDPFYFPVALVLQIVIKLRSKFMNNIVTTGVWNTVKSTK